MNRLVNIRRSFAAAVIVAFATFVVLAARQLGVTPVRRAPDFRVFGSEKAPLQIYEYTDLSCPACAAANGTVRHLAEVYGSDVRISFKHYPLEMHKWAETAAVYADCAGEQGKFPDYTGMLFDRQREWADSREEPIIFNMCAIQLKLDWDRMKVCVKNPETLKRVRLDAAEGGARGVNATPTFFVNGDKIVGAGQLIERAKDFDNIIRKKKHE